MPCYEARESSPRMSLDVCWWLTSQAQRVYQPLEIGGVAGRHYCGHSRCDNCLVQKASVKRPMWMFDYGKKLTKVLWADGPWSNKYEAFRRYEQTTPPTWRKIVTPPWWCHLCVANAVPGWHIVNQEHLCMNKGDKGKRCSHVPCKDCWEEQPKQAKVPKQRTQLPVPAQLQQARQQQTMPPQQPHPQYQVQQQPQHTSTYRRLLPRQQQPQQQSDRDRRSRSKSTPEEDRHVIYRY